MNKQQTTNRLSVLLPVYNPNLDELKNAIESILSQSYSKFELLIIDDGSDEKTKIELDKFKNQDARITIYRNQKNLGLVATLNLGLKLCNSELIARMDADDWSYPYRFEEQIKFLDEHPNISVLSTEAVWMDNNTKIFKEPIRKHKDIISTLPFYCCIVHPSVMFRKKDIISIGGYPDLYGAEDYALWAKIGFNTNLKMAILPKICLKYRRSESSIKYGGKQAISTQIVENYIFSLVTTNKNDHNSCLPISTHERLDPYKLDKLYKALNKKFDTNKQLLRLNYIRKKKNNLKFYKTQTPLEYIRVLCLRIKYKIQLFVINGKL